MNPRFSIILPYLSSSRCIRLCKQALQDHAAEPFELCEIVDCTDVYAAYNEGADKATSPILVFLNDDMIVARDWDRHLVEATGEKTIVTTYLVESGRIRVNHRNIERNFGDPESFDGEAFQSFVDEHSAEVPDVGVGFGWYMPFAVRKEDFIPFPNETKDIPNDAVLFGKFASRGYKFLRVRSYAYHFQKMSS